MISMGVEFGLTWAGREKVVAISNMAHALRRLAKKGITLPSRASRTGTGLGPAPCVQVALDSIARLDSTEQFPVSRCVLWLGNSRSAGAAEPLDIGRPLSIQI